MDALFFLADAGRQLWISLPALTLWTGAVLLVALALDRLLRAYVGPGTRALLFAAVLVRAVLPLDWHAPLGVLPAATLAADPALPVVAPPEPLAHAVAPAPSPAAAPTPIAMAEPTLALDGLGLGIAAIYLAGLLGFLVAIAVRLRAARPDAAMLERVELEHTEVRVHPSAGPMLVGLVRPRIVLPRAFLACIDRDVLGAVVRHELAHARHRDGWIALALAIACALAWPIVPVWIAAARIRLALEMRADAAALHGLAEPAARSYRRLLLELATQRWQVPAITVGLGAVAGLRARLAAMKLAPRTPWMLQLAFTVPLAIALLVCAGERDGTTAHLVADALADAPVLRVDTRQIPFPHCRGTSPTLAIPQPPDVDRDALAQSRSRLGLAAAAMLEPPVTTVDWTSAIDIVPPLDASTPAIMHAEARFVRGLSHLRRGRLAEAELDLAETAWQSGVAEDDYMMAEAAFTLVGVLEGLGRADEARAWSRHAEAASHRLGFDRFVGRIDAERARARMAATEGRDDDARAHEQHADELLRACAPVVVGRPG